MPLKYSRIMVINGMNFALYSASTSIELALKDVEALLKDKRSAYVVSLHNKKWLVYARPLTEYEKKVRAR